MAKSKSSNMQLIPLETQAMLLQLADAMTQAEAERQQKAAEMRASMEATAHKMAHPLAYLTDSDIKAVENRLGAVLHSLRAIYQLAGEGMEADGELHEAYAIAIQEMARANVKGVDACLARLSGGLRYAGNWENELEELEAA